MQQGTGQDTPIPLPCLTFAIVAGIAVLALLMARLDLRIALNGACAAFAMAAILLLLIRHMFRATGPRPRQIVSDCAENILAFATIALVGATASYAVAAYTHGWVDHAMVRFDHAIGFDWRDMYTVTAAHPILQISGKIAYASIFISPAILILAFARSGQRAEARIFLATFWVAAVLTLCLFLFMPTLGPLAYMWQGPIPYMPTSALYQAELIPLLRDDHMKVIDLAVLRGLVGPPSFHTASAIIYILAARHTGPLRKPLTLLNVAMLFSIPVEGTHYAVDIIGGIAVALTAHGAVKLLVRSLQPVSDANIDRTPYGTGVGRPAPEGVS